MGKRYVCNIIILLYYQILLKKPFAICDTTELEGKISLNKNFQKEKDKYWMILFDVEYKKKAKEWT